MRAAVTGASLGSSLPESVAEAVSFLACPSAAFGTGTTIHVDAGRRAD